MDESKEQLRRLAIAIETLATMLLESNRRIEDQLTNLTNQFIAKNKTMTAQYWVRYVAGPVIVGLLTFILSHFATK